MSSRYPDMICIMFVKFSMFSMLLCWPMIQLKVCIKFDNVIHFVWLDLMGVDTFPNFKKTLHRRVREFKTIDN